MKKGRSNYNIPFNCDVNTVNQLVQSYMSANRFVPDEKKGEKYFKSGDAMVGYKFFNYSINGNNLTINAWLKGAFGEIGTEQDGLAGINVMVMSYRNSLNTLFQEISKLNNGSNINSNQNITGNVPNTGQSNYDNSQNNMNHSQQISNSTSQFSQNFQNETIKKQEQLCEIGFWLSIFGLLCSFVGITYGILVYIMDFYFASQGLKTRKKGKAKATIVLSIISILITILKLLS